MPLARILHLELTGFLYALAAVVFFQIFTRRINLAGLLSQKDQSDQVSPERVQLLLATIAACGSYLNKVAGTTGGKMPDVSHTWLYLFGGSSAIYAAGKAWATWSKKAD